VNSVDDVPKDFKDWLDNNKDKAKRSYSMPYFIKDNPQYLPKDYQKLYGMKTPYENYADYEKAMKYNNKHAMFSAEQRANIRELNESLPVLQGKIMNFSEADQGRANPNFSVDKTGELGYRHNCQTCTMAYELRRRGFDVQAAPNPIMKGYDKRRDFNGFCFGKGIDWKERFLNPDGSFVTPIKSIGIKNTVEAKREFIEANIRDEGRYEIYCRWNNTNAHVFIIEKQKGGNIVWYDPQTSEIAKFKERYILKMIHSDIWITRIDDKLINPKFADRFLKSKH